MRSNAFNVTIEVTTAVLLLLWIYTGLNKLIHYDKFSFEAGRSPFLHDIAPLVAVMIPVSELVMAALLVCKRTRVTGLYGSLFLMTLFTGYVYIMLHYAYDLPCSCGGIIELLTWEQHLVINGALTLLTAVAIFLQSRVALVKKRNLPLS